MKHNIFAWVEIPVNNMERAIKFYEKVLILLNLQHPSVVYIEKPPGMFISKGFVPISRPDESKRS